MAFALVALGANLDDPTSQLNEAGSEIASLPGTDVVQFSPLFQTAAVGGLEGQGVYVNAACLVETRLDVGSFFRQLQAVEDRLGRVRETRWGPRRIDLDLILFDEQIVETEDLIVPHPRFCFRRFVLVPAVTLDCPLRDPVSGRTLGELLEWIEESRSRIGLHGFSQQQLGELSEASSLAGGAFELVTGAPQLPQQIELVDGDGDSRSESVLLDVHLQGARPLTEISQVAYNCGAGIPWLLLPQAGGVERWVEEIHAALLASSTEWSEIREMQG